MYFFKITTWRSNKSRVEKKWWQTPFLVLIPLKFLFVCLFVFLGVVTGRVSVFSGSFPGLINSQP